MRAAGVIGLLGLCLFVLATVGFASAVTPTEDAILIRDFEFPGAELVGDVITTEDGVAVAGFYHGPSSTIEIHLETEIAAYGDHSLYIFWDRRDWVGLWMGGGYSDEEVDPEIAWESDWREYDAISFWFYGEGVFTEFAMDINDYGHEQFRATWYDEEEGWQRVVLCLPGRSYDGECADMFRQRADWQPDHADLTGEIAWPIRGVNIEPLGTSFGEVYVDLIEVVRE